ncbi:hypothetical protein EDC04DRAFT_2903717 [Pisolithus marmoratus]|nr:hypothetical protein EDC04DRAFT_2903717 [Pisolithus marmoratus]
MADIACETPCLPSSPVVEQKHKVAFTRLHFDVTHFESRAAPAQLEKRARLQVYNVLAAVLRRRFRGCQVKMFGSAAQDLALHSSDIDIALLSPEKMGHKVLFQIAWKLENVGLVEPTQTQVRHQARVPVLSVQTKPEFGSLRFDIVVNNEDGVKVTPIVQKFLRGMPALRPLLLTIKVFLSQRGLNSAATGGPSSYVLTCMVIHFLQANPYRRSESQIDDPIRSESLGYLLLDFMQYYGSEFPYETHYISVKAGKLLPKEDAPWISENCYRHLCVECLTTEKANIARALNKTKALKAALSDGFTQLRDLMGLSDLGTTSQERTPSEGSSFRCLSSSGFSYLDNIIAMAHQASDQTLDFEKLTFNVKRFKERNAM